MIKAEDFKWLDRVYHLFHLGSYLCLSLLFAIGPVVLEEKMFENVDGRTTDGRTTELLVYY